MVAQPEAPGATPEGRRAPEIPVTPAAASINRIIVVDLPGQPVDEEVRGKRASYLLSIPALIRYAQAHADALCMPRAYREADPELHETRRELPRWVVGCLRSPDPEVRASAHALARRLGRNLGTIVATLHRGDAVNRAARPDWTDAEWEHWRHVQRVWIGGGIVSGALGAEMVRHAQVVLAETSCDQALTIVRTPYPQHMATLGAARFLPRAGTDTATEHALVMDFGQTSVKRAVVSYRNGAVARVIWLPAQPASWRWPSPPTDGRPAPPRPATASVAREVLDFVVEAICTGLALAEGQLESPIRPDILAGIAADVDGGAVLGNGVYALMQQLAGDVRPLIADGVAATCGRRISLSIIHDGAAAAAVHAGDQPSPSAVIVVGTALGVGFPSSSAAGLRPIAPDLGAEAVPQVPRTPPTASINRVVIVDLPGRPVDDAVRGEQAYHLLSVPAMIRYAQQRAGALNLPAEYRDADPELPFVRRELPRWLDKCLKDPRPDVRSAAAALGERLGRNLGYLLATLHRGDAVNRAARTEWTDAEWADWAEVRHVWLGGGVMSGDLGDEMLIHARAVLAETGCADALQITKTGLPRHMATLGAARYLPRSGAAADTQIALALDLGQTSAKRAVLTFEQDLLTHIAWLPTLPVDWPWRNSPDAGRDIDGREVLDVVAGTICRSLQEARERGTDAGTEMVMSIAAYVDGGRLLGNGIYARMQQLADDVRPLIAGRVATLCGRRINVTLIHDGTAAAAVHAGELQVPSAVIVVGTALGVGFPPKSATGLRAVLPDLPGS